MKLANLILSLSLVCLTSYGNSKDAFILVSREKAFRIAKTEIVRVDRKINFRKYRTSINSSKVGKNWIVSFQLKAEYSPRPGDYMSVIVNAEDGSARFMPGM